MSQSNNDEQLSFDFDEIKLDDIEDIDISSFTIDTLTWADTITITGSTLDSHTTWSNGYNMYNPTSGTVLIDKGGITMETGTDIRIGSKSIFESIEKIEERLGILHPNPELEDRWDQLKSLRNQYMELENDILEKEKILNILKNT